MKFTCESCSAQYMIADEKIGARGVKVRCKKCSHVIILKRGDAAKSPSEPVSGASAAPHAPAPGFPSLDLGALSASESALELPPTSSEMGLSAEFSAVGFDDTQSSQLMPSRKSSAPPAPRSGRASEPIRLPGTPVASSPFDLAPAGGSLGDFSDEAPNTELSAFPAFGSPGLRSESGGNDDDPFQTTKVEPGPDAVAKAFGRAAARADSETSQEAETRVAPVEIPKEAVPGFGDETTSESDEPSLPKSGGALALPSFDFGHSLAASLEEDDEEDEDEPTAPPKSALAFGIEESEATLAQKASSEPPAPALQLGGDLSGDLDDAPAAPPVGAWTPEDGLGDLDVGDFDIGSGRLGGRGPSRPSPSSAPVQHQESTAVGVVMADTQHSGDAEIIASQMAGMSKEHLDAELGSALDAVFGEGSEENPQPSSTGPDPFASLVASAKGAIDSSDIVPEADRKETRVFDNQAMARVQDEQARAFGGAEPEPEEAKEWYVGIEEEQVGPITLSEFRRHWDEASVDANSLCWRQGMGDWTAIRFIDELASLLDRPQNKKAKTPERASIVPMSAPSPERVEPLAARSFTPLGGGAMAAAAGGATESNDVSDWRPSAASALASLAAAELDGPGKANDIQVGPVLPVRKTGGGAFENLIEKPTRSQSLFGIQEETSASMPSVGHRAPELVSPVALAPNRPRPSVPAWLPPTIAVVVGIIVLGGLMWKLIPGTPTPAETAAPTAPTEIAQAGLNPKSAPSAPTELSPPPAEEVAPAPERDVPPPEPELVAPPKAAAADSEPDPSESSKAERRKSKRERSSEGSSSKRRSRREREEEPEPPAPPPPSRSRSTADDLLDNAGSSRRGSSEREEPARSTLDESDIFKVLKNNRSVILGCVEKQRKADSSLEGVMTVKFVIQGSGKTSGQSVEPSKFAGTPVGKCVISAVKRWSFPSFTGRSIPLDFPVKVTGG